MGKPNQVFNLTVEVEPRLSTEKLPTPDIT